LGVDVPEAEGVSVGVWTGVEVLVGWADALAAKGAGGAGLLSLILVVRSLEVAREVVGGSGNDRVAERRG
jgi:hypothetical protein